MPLAPVTCQLDLTESPYLFQEIRMAHRLLLQCTHTRRLVGETVDVEVMFKRWSSVQTGSRLSEWTGPTMADHLNIPIRMFTISPRIRPAAHRKLALRDPQGPEN